MHYMLLRDHGMSRTLRRATYALPAVAGIVSLAVSSSTQVSAATPAPTPGPSAIGTEVPGWIIVSPAYTRTGVVLASGSDAGCNKQSCVHLYISHDRGASWHRVDTNGYSAGRALITVDHSGHEILFGSSPAGLQRSDDLGTTWSHVGGVGLPTVSPAYASDQTVAVAGSSDYVLRGSVSQTVAGSGGTMSDAAWTLPAGYPSPGGRAPVLLSGLSGNSQAPAVERCTTSFACSSPVTFPAPDSFAGPPMLDASSTYAQDGTVFAHTAEGVYKSTDGGSTFVPVVLPPTGASKVGIAALALSPTYSESADRHLYVAEFSIFGTGQSMTSGGSIFASSDGGQTWTDIAKGSPLASGAISVVAAPEGRLFAGYVGRGGGGILCSPDGKTWQAFCGTPAGSSSSGAQGNGHPQGNQTCATCSPAVAGNAGSTPQPGVNGAGADGANGSGTGASTGTQLAAVKPPEGSPLRVVLLVVAGLLLVGAAATAVLRRRSGGAEAD
jgi:hypothetical protein